MSSSSSAPRQVDFIPVEKWYFCRYDKCAEMFYTKAQLGNHFLGSHPGVKLEVPSPKDLTMKGVLQGMIIVNKCKPKQFLPAQPEAVSNAEPESLAAPSSRPSRQVNKNLKCSDPHPKRAHRILETRDGGTGTEAVPSGEATQPAAITRNQRQKSSGLPNRKRAHRSHQPKKKTLSLVRCHLCHKSFGRKSALNQHLVLHSGNRRFKCNDCGATFYKHWNLRRHLQTFHKQNSAGSKICGIYPVGSSIYSCSDCPYYTNRPGILRKHSGLHQKGSNGFPCLVCQVFVTREGLSNHNRYHHSQNFELA